MDKVISATLKVLAVLLTIWLLYFLRDVVAYFVFAFVIASALRPGIDFLEKRKIPRALSGILIFILFLIFISLILAIIFPPLITEVQNFFTSSPQISQNFIDLISKLDKAMGGVGLLEDIKNSLLVFIQGLSQSLTAAAGVLSGFFGGLFNLIFVVIISFYFAVEKKTAERISGLIASGNRRLEDKILKGWKRAETIAGRWLYSYFILGTIVGLLVYVGLSLVGVKYALVLAVLAAVLEVIPMLGPILAGVIGSFLALVQGGVPMALWTALVFVIVQQLENFLIVPFVMRKRVDLHPILVIVVLFIAGKVFGVLGAVLSIPLTAITIALVKENYSDYFIERRVKPLFRRNSK